MKKVVQILLVLVGCAPAALGLAMERYVIPYISGFLPLKLVGIVFLLVTALIAFLGERYLKNTRQVVLLLALPAFADLVLLFIQRLVLRYYWPGMLGLLSQVFYEPLMFLVSSIMFRSSSMAVLYMLCFLVLVLAILAGCKLSRKHRNA